MKKNKNKFQLVGVIGKLNSGKDTLAENLVQLGFNKRAFADPLKLFIHELFGIPKEILWGPSEAKTGEVRQMMQELGTDYARKFRPNIWVDKTKEAINIARHQEVRGVVVPDVRFINEAQMLRDEGGILIRILRSDCTSHETSRANHHPSETESNTIPDEWVTHTITNNGTLQDLQEKITAFLWTEEIS